MQSFPVFSAGTLRARMQPYPHVLVCSITALFLSFFVHHAAKALLHQQIYACRLQVKHVHLVSARSQVPPQQQAK